MVSKLDLYDIKGITLTWLKSYLNEQNQYVSYSDVNKTNMCSTICGVPQGSNQRRCYLCKISTTFKSVMFGDDANFFLSNKDTKKLFNDMNVELQQTSFQSSFRKLRLHQIQNETNKKDIFPLIKEKISSCKRFSPHFILII